MGESWDLATVPGAGRREVARKSGPDRPPVLSLREVRRRRAWVALPQRIARIQATSACASASVTERSFGNMRPNAA